MELRAGYKQTEVGIIPSDWDASTIGDNTKWMSGGTPSRNNIEYWSGSIPWISGSTLKNVEISTSDQFLTAEAVSAGSKMAPIGSTLLLVRGSALHNEIRAGLVVLPVSFNQDVKALVPIGEIDPKFLTFFILGQSSDLLKLVSSAGNSAGVLDTKLVQNFKFLKPALEEQKTIVEALSDADALIGSLQKLIAKKRQIKQGVMQTLLNPYANGALKPGWSLTKMGDLGDTYGGLTGKSKKDFGRGSPYIPFMNVMANTVIDPLWVDYVSIDQGDIQNKAEKGDLFFNGSSETPEEAGFCSVLLEDIPNLHLNSFCFGFRFWKEMPASGVYFAYWFRSAEGRKKMAILAQGATRYNIAKSAFLKLEFYLPTESIQKHIAAILSDMDSEIAALETKLAKYQKIKQSMMQNLLTGRIRLV